MKATKMERNEPELEKQWNMLNPRHLQCSSYCVDADCKLENQNE